MITVLARGTAVVALLSVAVTTLWPAGLGPLPAWAALPAAVKLALVLFAVALVFVTGPDARPVPRLATAAIILGGIAVATWIVTFAAGTTTVLAKIGAEGTLAKWLMFRPPVVTAAGIALLGASLLLRRDDSERYDASAWLAMAAAAAFFLVCVGHLYGAVAITTGPAATPSTVPGAVLLLAVALLIFALHPKDPMAAYAGNEAGAVAKRRLLPAAVLTPIGSGFLLVYALTTRQLSPTSAVALVVFANVLVMLLLVNVAGNKVARVVWDRQKRAEAREAQIRKQGLRDPMTALLNRRGWDAEVQAGERQCRAEGLNACVLVIDLDGLKQVNDREGHKAGDAYIHRAAAAMRKAARRGEPLARLGGDEFAYLVVGCDETAARAVVARFQDSLRASRVSASVGYAMRGGRSLAEAFEEADQAMYVQKRARKVRRA